MFFLTYIYVVPQNWCVANGKMLRKKLGLIRTNCLAKSQTSKRSPSKLENWIAFDPLNYFSSGKNPQTK